MEFLIGPVLPDPHSSSFLKSSGVIAKCRASVLSSLPFHAYLGSSLGGAPVDCTIKIQRICLLLPPWYHVLCFLYYCGNFTAGLLLLPLESFRAVILKKQKPDCATLLFKPVLSSTEVTSVILLTWFLVPLQPDHLGSAPLAPPRLHLSASP